MPLSPLNIGGIMAESTLSGAYSDFRSEIADFLGYGRDSSNWSTDQENSIKSCLKSGLRKFYHPPVLPGERLAHEWSFLNPVTTLDIGPVSGTMSGVPTYDGSTYSTITATSGVFESRMDDAGNTTNITFDTSGNDYEITSYTSDTVIVVSGDASGETSGDTFSLTAQFVYDLPDDYGGINGGFTFTSDTLYDTVRVVSEKQIRELMQGRTVNGYPQYCAIRPKSTSGTTGQRFEVMFYPRPDSSYTLEYSYIPLLYELTDTYTYPWGGEPHTETIMESCLAVAELRRDDTIGVHYEAFMERLKASVDYDRVANAPEFLGYNADGSIYKNRRARPEHMHWTSVNTVEYIS